jgi:uncharacterized membrane protein YfcA
VPDLRAASGPAEAEVVLAAAVRLPLPLQIFLGLVVGFGSAVTGTGGPFLVLPLLLLLRPRLPTLWAVGLAQAVPLPIALAATLANAWFGEVDMCVAAAVAATVIPGLPVGVYFAHRTAMARTPTAAPGKIHRVDPNFWQTLRL